MSHRRWLAALLLAGVAACAWATDTPDTSAPQPGPVGEPVAAAVIEDPDFGVRTNRFGLDRRVEMYQWQRDRQGGYQQVWKPALVDSSTFPEGYRNPPAFPLEGRIWWASGISLDGRPVDPSVIKALGRWQDFRPGFTRLPANLAASFQPEGDGLGSALNPLDPHIGDLRIHWRALHLPPLAGKVKLRDGKWQLAVAGQAGDPLTASEPDLDAAGSTEQLPKRGEVRLVGKVILGVLVALGLLLLRRIRRRAPRR